MTPKEEAVVTTLRAAIREGTTPRGVRKGLSYREMDRLIGRDGQNWTSKFLKGPTAEDFPGVPSVGTLLEVLEVLRIEPVEFFERAFPPDRPERATRETEIYLARVGITAADVLALAREGLQEEIRLGVERELEKRRKESAG